MCNPVNREHVAAHLNDIRQRIAKTISDCQSTRRYLRKLVTENKRFIEEARRYLASVEWPPIR